MAQRTMKGRAVHGDELEVHLSSGYTVSIRRPPLQVLRAVMAKAEELYPLPDKPSTTLHAATGVEYVIEEDVTSLDLAEDDSPEMREYKRAATLAAGKRHEHLLEYAFRTRLVVNGYDTPEKQAELVQRYAADRAEMLEWGTLSEDMRDLDAWQLTLRCFVVADSEDLAAVFFAVMKAFDDKDVTPEEVRRRANFTT